MSSGRQSLWPVRHCLTRHTASLSGQTQPAVRPSVRLAARPAYYYDYYYYYYYTLSGPAHNLSDPANTRPYNAKKQITADDSSGSSSSFFWMTPEFREHSEACNRGRKRPRISLTAWRHGTLAVAGLLPHPKGFY